MFKKNVFEKGTCWKLKKIKTYEKIKTLIISLNMKKTSECLILEKVQVIVQGKALFCLV